MVREYIVICYCNSCLKEWSIEPEPNYPTAGYWKEANETAPIPKVDADEVRCPFCGSGNTGVEDA